MTTAAEENARTRGKRQEAADRQAAHVDLEEQKRRTKALTAAVNSTIETLNSLAADRDAINSKSKAALDELEAQGIDRGALKALMKMEAMSDEERQRFLAHFRFLCGARKYPDMDQLEMYGPLALKQPDMEGMDDDDEGFGSTH